VLQILYEFFSCDATIIPPVTSVTVQIYAVMDAYRLVLGYRFFCSELHVSRRDRWN